MLAQSDLEAASSARALAAAYDLIVFPGHHEYVTTREYDLVEGYREPRRQPHVPLREQLLLAGRAGAASS